MNSTISFETEARKVHLEIVNSNGRKTLGKYSQHVLDESDHNTIPSIVTKQWFSVEPVSRIEFETHSLA